eukprot:jgi/Botrbrau1/12314/Bobra.0205s0012.1
MSRPKAFSLVSRLASGLEYIFTRRELVGIDANGNKYLRWTEKNLDGDIVEKRTIRTPDRSYDPTTVPPEWFRWLQKTRAEPPTQEEIEMAQQRRVVLRQRVQALEIEEARRRLQAEGLRNPAGGPDLNRFVQQLTAKGETQHGRPLSNANAEADSVSSSKTTKEGHQQTGSERPSEAASSSSTDFQPEAWKPGG